MERIKKLNFILNRRQKVRFFELAIIVFIGTFLELLGVSAILPFVEVVLNPATIEKRWYLKLLYDFFHVDSVNGFLILLALILMLIYIVKNFYLSMMYFTQYKITYNMQNYLANRLMRSYMQKDYIFHLTSNSSEVLRNIMNDTTSFVEFLNSVINFAIEILVAVVLLVFLFIQDKTLIIGLAVCLGVFMGVFLKLFRHSMLRNGEKSRQYYAYILKNVQEGLGGIKEIKVLNRERYFMSQFQQNYDVYTHVNRNSKIMSLLPKYVMEAFMIVGLLGVVCFKLARGIPAEYFISTISVFAVAATRLMPSVNKMLAYINGIAYSAPSLDALYNDLQEIRDVEEKKFIPEKAQTESKQMEFEREIELRNISYQYPGTDVWVLQGIHLLIRKNTSVALIGPSGAGKTTLADILLGILSPQEGNILVDGIPVEKDISLWQKKLGYIPQSIFLVDDTIRRNVALGIEEPEIDDEKIRMALEKAQLYEFVMSLKDGTNTIVGESGVRLSGGQRQRIGIARALYHDPEILVLDEATSALDNTTESAVMEAIESLSGSKTMVIIAHRLTTIEKCDEVYEVDHHAITKVR